MDNTYYQKKPITCTECNHKFRFSSQEDRTTWENNKSKCPECDSLYADKPKTERELFALQAILLNSTTNQQIFQKTIVKMYNLLFQYCRSILLKSYISYLNYESEANDYASTAVWILLEKYYDKTKNFKILRSFAGYLKKGKLQEALFHEDDRLESDRFFNTNVELRDFEDTRNSFYKIEEEDQKEYLYKHITETLTLIENFCVNKSENFTRLLALENFLYEGEDASDSIFKNFGRDGKWLFLKTLNIIKGELSIN